MSIRLRCNGTAAFCRQILRGPGARPRPLEAAAQPAGDIHHFADKETHAARFHSPR